MESKEIIKLIENSFSSFGETPNGTKLYVINEFDLKELKKQLTLTNVVSSKILIDKKDLLELTTKAIKEGFNTYEIVDSGLESFDADAMAKWIISKYV